jgi:hypothetical protein
MKVSSNKGERNESKSFSFVGVSTYYWALIAA